MKKNSNCITEDKNVQQWWFDDVLGLNSFYLCFLMIFPHFFFLVFISIYKYAN